MEQLTKNQAVAASEEAVQNQNEPQLRDENSRNDKSVLFFFFQAEDGIRDLTVTGVQTCALPIFTLLIHTHVREDALALFGFVSAREKHFFELLISASGVGPSLALKILSGMRVRSEEHTSELQSQSNLVCRLLLEKKKKIIYRLSFYARS